MYRTTYDEEQRLWSGIDCPPVFNPHASLGRLILYAMKTHSTRMAQISDDSGITVRYDEMLSMSIRAAQNLRARGYIKGQIIGFIAANSHHVAPIVFASLYLGCPINTLDPSFGKNDIIHMLSTTKPSLMFCDAKKYDLLKECLDELENDAAIFTFDGQIGDSETVESLFEETDEDEQDFVPTNVDGMNDASFIICSSGTTGPSKGVCISHAALSDKSTCFFKITCDDVLLCYSSLYWISGVVFLIGGTLFGAKRVITTQPPSMETFLRTIEQYKVTKTLSSPFQVTSLAKSELLKTADLSSLRCFFTAGSRIPQDIPLQINKYLPNGRVHIVYGLSEIAGVCANDYPRAHGQDTVGQLSEGTQVKLIDDNGDQCGVGVEGEVCIKASHTILGYYDNQEANDELFDEEGFIKTGDLAHFDENGYLYIVDRKKAMLKYRNAQIAPSYIEAHLSKSPLIRSVCVVGIPDDLDGDLPAACIIPTEGAEIDEEIVHNMIDDSFADYYKLRGGVFFVESLPTTPSGKLLRRKVMETVIELHNQK